MNTIGITMGCPASIGPEIILRYFQQLSSPSTHRTVIVGDKGVLRKSAGELGIDVELIDFKAEQPAPAVGIEVLNLSRLDLAAHQWGVPTDASSRAMAEYITTCVRLTQQGTFDGMVTCPISKSSLNNAGYAYPGHTEMLADLTSTERFTMMMAGNSLKVTLSTIHCALSEVPKLLTIDSVADLIAITYHALKVDFGIQAPKVAVAGLNPHSGEEGLFGQEEKEIIQPAIQKAMKSGILASGPFPPDTVFFKAASGDFDAVVCMYHDQGLIPFKLLHFEDGVNVTLGLPIVRTSVDHGTAYDIAGQGKADASSLAAAIDMAAMIAENRLVHSKGIH